MVATGDESTPIHAAVAAHQQVPLSAAVDRCVSELSAAADGCNVTVIGAPGTGKTTLVCRVYEKLLGLPDSSADDILVITPNREHANQLRDRLGTGRDGIRSAPAARSIHSFAFGLVSARDGAQLGRASTFVSGAEQDVFLAEMLDGYELGRAPAPDWPEHLSAEVRATRGFRDQLREALNEVMARTLSTAEVTAAAQTHGRQEWAVLGHIMAEYLDLNTFSGFGGVDTASVLTEAQQILRDQDSRGVRAGRVWDFSVATRPAAEQTGQRVPRFVLVDAAQDLPDGALQVLAGLRALGCRILVTASPDTTTQAFRGATGLLLRQATRHTEANTGLAGPGGMCVLTLDPLDPACRGAGALAGLWHRFAGALSAEQAYGHLPAGRGAQAADAESSVGDEDSPAEGEGSPADFAVYASAAERTRGIARTLRRWHHDAQLDWSECAVLCRTAGTAAALAQELEHLGIPVSGSGMSLAADPATAPLLRLLALDQDDAQAVEAVARELLTGVYGGADALAVRGLERELAVLTGSADGALVTALRTRRAAELPRELGMVQRLLATAAEVKGTDPHSALWQLWETSDAARRWEPRASAQPTHPLNDRLDAVIRLMTLAERYSGGDAMPARGFAMKVLEQDFAQDSLARQHHGDMVVVDSPAGVAHRDFTAVIVADVNDGQWPNPKIRGSIFDTADLCDALGGNLPVDAPETDSRTAQAARFAQRRRTVIRDEARLLLAALSRARKHLLITALDDGESTPSGFFTLLRPDTSLDTDPAAAEEPAEAADALAAAAPELAAEQLSVRSIAALARNRFETATTPDEREQWAQLLAALAAAQVGEAHTSAWQRWYERSSSAPIREADEMVTLSPSAMESFATCPLQWFLSRHSGEMAATQAQTTGTLIHALAEEFPDGDLLGMQQAFEEKFAELEFDSEWEREAEYAAIANMVSNLSTYLRGRSGASTRVGVEATISAVETDPEQGGPWQIRGRLDRIEQLADGRGLYVIDFKTGKNPTGTKEMPTHAQLGTYQAALAHPSGAVELTDGTQLTGTPAGAELVFLRKTKPTLREQPALQTEDDSPDGLSWAARMVNETARQMRSAHFPATPSADACRYCRVRSSCPAVMDSDSEEGRG